MSNLKPFSIGVCAIAFLLCFSSCRKDIFSLGQDPLTSKEQVAEFHDNEFEIPPTSIIPPHYPFAKTFDNSGKVTELICYFDIEETQSYVLNSQLHLKLIEKGRKVFFINLQSLSHGINDTAAILYLNTAGRPDSCVGDFHFMENQVAGKLAVARTSYHYQNDRLASVSAFDLSGPVVQLNGTEAITYDQYGNALSFHGNSYQYDYTRTAKQQFYSNDYMQNYWEFYMLQYLGYFPEVTSPTHIRSAVQRVSSPGFVKITGHQFDGKGRLVSYDFNTHFTTTWR